MKNNKWPSLLKLTILIIITTFISANNFFQASLEIKPNKKINILKPTINFSKNLKIVKEDYVSFKIDNSDLVINEGDFTLDNVYLESTKKINENTERTMTFPRNVSNQNVNFKALLQNYYARKLLYFPDPKIQEQILYLAKKLIPIIDEINQHARKDELLLQLLFVTRTTNHLFNQSTINQMADFIIKIAKKEKSNIDYKDIITITSTFCGINDIFYVPRSEDAELIKIIQSILIKNINFKYPTLDLDKNIDFLSKFNYMKTGVLRNEQMIRVRTNFILNGLFGYGEIIDKHFFKEKEEKLKALKFQYCKYDVDKLNGVTEPLACGPSGSLSSTMFMWNNFMHVDTDKLLDKSITENDYKTNHFYKFSYVEARILAIVAVYISLGFHSAAEVIETYYSLKGIDLRTKSDFRFFIPFYFTDFSDIRSYDATKIINTLLNEYSTKKEDEETVENYLKNEEIIKELNNLKSLEKKKLRRK